MVALRETLSPAHIQSPNGHKEGPKNGKVIFLDKKTSKVSTTLEPLVGKIDPSKSLQIYSKELSGVPQLNLQERKELESKFQLEQRLIKWYEEKGADYVSKEQKESELKSLKQSFRESHQRLFESALRLAAGVALRYQGRGFEDIELIQFGNLALLKALETYDAEKANFSTYATSTIKLYIQNEIRKNNRGRFFSLDQKVQITNYDKQSNEGITLGESLIDRDEPSVEDQAIKSVDDEKFSRLIDEHTADAHPKKLSPAQAKVIKRLTINEDAARDGEAARDLKMERRNFSNRKKGAIRKMGLIPAFQTLIKG